MSTQKRNSCGERMARLLVANEKVFHLKDLALLWKITNYNTLRTTVKRYCQKSLINHIYKGLYSVEPKEKVDPLLLGKKIIHGYCYLSTESILFIEGYISRKIVTFTFVSSSSKRYCVGKNQYRIRQLKSKFLFNSEGLIDRNGILYANVYRAIADMLYFNPQFHFDREIDWKEVKKMQLKIGYPLTPNRYVDSKRE